MNGYWMGAIISLWVLLSVTAVAQLGLLRRMAPLLDAERPHQHPSGVAPGPGGVGIGERPGQFRATTAAGHRAGLDSLRGQPTLVVLTSAGCLPCDQLVRELRDDATGPWPVRVVVITNAHDDPAALALPEPFTVLRQHDGSAAAAFGTTATPYAFALDPDCVVRGRGIPSRAADLQTLAVVLQTHEQPVHA